MNKLLIEYVSFSLLFLIGSVVSINALEYPITDGFQFPLKDYRVGVNNFRGTAVKEWHLGEDAGAIAKTEVYPIGIGIVRYVGNIAPTKGGYGGVVIIEHNTGTEFVTAVYGHMDYQTITVSVGQTIYKDTVLGKIGTTAVNGGWGEHLHLGIWKGAYVSGNYYYYFDDAQQQWRWTWAYLGYTQYANLSAKPGPPWDVTPALMLEAWYDPSDFIQSHQTPISLVGYYSTGWHDDGTSQAFLDAYHRNGGQNVLGIPRNNGGTEFVHEWDGIYLQDFTAPSFDPLGAVIMYNSNQKKAYVVKGAFLWDLWLRYAKHSKPSFIGMPQNEEHPEGIYLQVQDFSSGIKMLFWRNERNDPLWCTDWEGCRDDNSNFSTSTVQGVSTASLRVETTAALCQNPFSNEGEPSFPLYVPVWRMYKVFNQKQEHFYTRSFWEANNAREKWGYQFDNDQEPVFYTSIRKAPGMVKVHRLRKRDTADNMLRLLTTNPIEVESALKQKGYVEDSADLGYVYPNEDRYRGSDLVTLRRYWKATIGDRFYTSDSIEQMNVAADGYSEETTLGLVSRGGVQIAPTITPIPTPTFTRTFTPVLPTPTFTYTFTPTPTPTTAHIDLVIVSFGTARTSSNPYGDALVVVVKNIGNAPAGPFDVSVDYELGTVSWRVDGLGAGEDKELHQAEGGGGHNPSRTAYVDRNNEVVESNEGNNSKTSTFDIWPTPSPTYTSVPNPTATPVSPESASPIVTITDDWKSSEDLSNGIDSDAVDERILVIRWSPKGAGILAGISRTKVQVRVNEADYINLTGLNSSQEILVWDVKKAESLDLYQRGPQDRTRYQFRIIAVMTNNEERVIGESGFVDYYVGPPPPATPTIPSTPTPTRTNTPSVVFTPEITPTFTPTPTPAVSERALVWVLGDVNSEADISGGADHDPANERDLVIQWDFEDAGIVPEDVVDVVIYDQFSDESYSFVGQTGGNETQQFVWFGTDDRSKGPLTGTHKFFVYFLLKSEHAPQFSLAFTHTGFVEFIEEMVSGDTPTPTPTSTPLSTATAVKINTPTWTSNPSITPTPTVAVILENSPTPTSTVIHTVTPTAAIISAASPTITQTPTLLVPDFTPTFTPVDTVTPTWTFTLPANPSPTHTVLPMVTATPGTLAASTPTVTPTPVQITGQMVATHWQHLRDGDLQRERPNEDYTFNFEMSTDATYLHSLYYYFDEVVPADTVVTVWLEYSTSSSDIEVLIEPVEVVNNSVIIISTPTFVRLPLEAGERKLISASFTLTQATMLSNAAQVAVRPGGGPGSVTIHRMVVIQLPSPTVTPTITPTPITIPQAPSITPTFTPSATLLPDIPVNLNWGKLENGTPTPGTSGQNTFSLRTFREDRVGDAYRHAVLSDVSVGEGKAYRLRFKTQSDVAYPNGLPYAPVARIYLDAPDHHPYSGRVILNIPGGEKQHEIYLLCDTTDEKAVIILDLGVVESNITVSNLELSEVDPRVAREWHLSQPAPLYRPLFYRSKTEGEQTGLTDGVWTGSQLVYNVMEVIQGQGWRTIFGADVKTKKGRYMLKFHAVGNGTAVFVMKNYRKEITLSGEDYYEIPIDYNEEDSVIFFQFEFGYRIGEYTFSNINLWWQPFN